MNIHNREKIYSILLDVDHVKDLINRLNTLKKSIKKDKNLYVSLFFRDDDGSMHAPISDHISCVETLIDTHLETLYARLEALQELLLTL
jgi:DUF1365 family protein